MRRAAVGLGLVAVLIGVSVVAAAGQQRPRVTIRIDFPTGVSRELPAVPAPNGGQIQFLWEGSYRDFHFRWSIFDRDAGVIRFTLHAGREPDDEVLDEFDVTVGQPAVQTSTSPPLGFAVLRIED